MTILGWFQQPQKTFYGVYYPPDSTDLWPCWISRKHEDLLSSPLGEKLVTAVPGIGVVAAQQMAWMGITQASQLLGILLQYPLSFQERLWAEFGVRSDHAGFAYNALFEMVSKYMSQKTHFYPSDSSDPWWISRKHTDLLSSPLGEKHVTAVPGIGVVAAQQMAWTGITQATQLLEIYLQNPLSFQDRLWFEFGVNRYYSGFAYNALFEMVLKYMSLKTMSLKTHFYCFDKAFVNIPLGEKHVTDVRGIGPAAALRFAVRGITNVYQLLGLYLQDPLNFQTRLGEEFGVYSHHAEWANDALCDVSRYI